MAAKYPSFADAAANDLACPKCFQIYVTPHEPKNLPKCSHMCCSLCLKQMTEMTKGGLKIVRCPQCKTLFKLPKAGVDGLITSLTVRNLAEKQPEAIKQQLKEMVETERQIQASIDHEVREVEKAVESIMTQAQDMIQQIKDLGKPKLTETRQKIKQLEQQVNDIEQSQSKLETLTDDEFQTQTDALVNQIEKLKINEVTNRMEVYSAGKFIAQDIQLGRVVKARVLELASEFGRFDGAYGIASKPNGTLAVSDEESNPPQVLVYNYDNDEYKKQFQFNIALAQPNEMIGIAVSTDDDYLVTSLCAGFDVYSSEGMYQKTINVTTDPKQNVVAVSITTTKDGRILVGSAITCEGEEMVKSVITVHDTAGKILKTIPASIVPYRIADISGMYVAATASDEDKVCVYNLETGKETLNLDIPLAFGVCHDEESDCLLMGRATAKDEEGKGVCGSCVIEQYCCVTGKLVAVLARGLTFSAAMTITQDGMLAVADWDSVKVYKMK